MYKYLNRYIENNYSSKRVFLTAIFFRILTVLGFYKKYQKVNWTLVDRLIFICCGNICRSLLGHAIAVEKGLAADSYGTECRNGKPANAKTVEYAESIGVDIGSHLSKNIDRYAPKHGDLIVIMEPSHFCKVKTMMSEKVQVTYMGLWLDQPTSYIHDPYNSNKECFKKVFDNIVNSVSIMKSRICGDE